MDSRQSFEADTQAAEVVQPSDGALDNPTGRSQAAAVRYAASGNQRADAGRMQRLAIFVVIVAAVALYQRGFAQRTTTFATDRRNGRDQRVQLRHVVAIGAGENQRERDALRFGDEVMLRAGASAIGGIGSCF